LLTSRAEYRLLLRHDNADLRLRKYGYDIGLIEEPRYNNFLAKLSNIEEIKAKLLEKRLFPNKNTNEYLKSIGSTNLKDKSSAYVLLRRPEMKMEMLSYFVDLDNYSFEEKEQVEIDIKYEGYINKAMKQAEKLLKMEDYIIPDNLNYEIINNLALEAKEKLIKIKPLTIGQASRISGVNPADISILLVYLKSIK